jgi:hypothetical protein
MTTDLYTKAVLTVIALSLTVVAIQLSIKPAFAQGNNFSFTQGGQLRVSICNTRVSADGQVYCADVVNGGQLRISPQ